MVTPFFALCRYESLVIIGLVFLMFLLKKRWLLALSMLGLAALPVGIFGLISVRNGAQFLPNSVELKTGTPLLPVRHLAEDEHPPRLSAGEAAGGKFAVPQSGPGERADPVPDVWPAQGREWNQVLMMNTILHHRRLLPFPEQPFTQLQV